MNVKSVSGRFAAVVVYVLILLASALITPPSGLTPEGLKCLAILIAAVILWITNAIPASFTCLLLIAELSFMGVMTTKDIYSNAGSASLFFILIGFGLSAALMETNLPNHILRLIVRITGNNTGKLVAGFIILTSIVSLIVTNSCAIVCTVGICVALIKSVGNPEPGTSRLGKALMIGIVWGSCVGGLAMPVSNSLNVVICDLIEQYTGVSISFVEWMVAGVPIYLVSLIFLCWWVPKCYKPEPMTEEQFSAFSRTLDTTPSKFEPKDWKFTIIFLLMLIFWIVGNWIKLFNTVVVGAVGVGLMFFPGIDLCTGKKYLDSIKPSALIFIIAVIPIAAGMKATGAGQWIVDTVFANAGSWSAVTVLIMISLVTLIVGTVLPSGSSTAAICCTVMSGVALASGVSLHAMAIIVGIWASISYLFCFHGLYQFTFTYGYYDLKDTLKGGWFLTVFLFVICATIMAPFIYRIAGMA